MRLDRIDRMEHIEDILQQKIVNMEKELDSLGHMQDPEICQLRIMYAMDLGTMRNILLNLRIKENRIYRQREMLEALYDEIRSFKQGSDLGGEHEADLQQSHAEPDPCAKRGGGFHDVGRTGRRVSGYDAGDPLR